MKWRRWRAEPRDIETAPDPVGLQEELEREQEEERAQAGWPDALIKAIRDNEWDYVVMLRDGTMTRFVGTSSGKNVEWATLHPHTSPGKSSFRPPRQWVMNEDGVWDRGMDVRVSNILWATDGGS